MVITLFLLFSNFFELVKSVTLAVLGKWNTLAKFLEYLIPRWQFDLALHIKGNRWLEGLRWNNLDSAVSPYLFVLEQFLNVLDWVLELSLSGVEDRHLFYVFEVTVDIFLLDE